MRCYLRAYCWSAAQSDRARGVLESIEGDCSEVARDLGVLISLREEEDCDWSLTVERKEEDKLSSAIKIEGWLRVDLYPTEMTLELAMEGVSIIEESGRSIPSRVSLDSIREDSLNLEISLLL